MTALRPIRGWGPRTLLVLHDLSAQAGHAAARAALIARDHGAELVLAHAVRDAAAGLKAHVALDRLAGELGERFGVRSAVRRVHGDPLQAVVPARDGAVLLVLGAQRSNVLREWLFATPAERLIRLSGCPVLVVKKPPLERYRRVLVPVDFGPYAGAAVTAAAGLARPAPLELFHSLGIRDEATMRAADVPEAQMRWHRERKADRARSRMYQLVQESPGTAMVAPSIGFGDAAGTVLAKERAMRADLVVIGKQRRCALADFFLGSVTQRVLAASRSDVLVLPGVRKMPAGGSTQARLTE